jgi:N-acetylneuraminic acid mutarotase
LGARVVGHLPQPVSRAAAAVVGRDVVVLGGLAPGDVTTGRVVTVRIGSYAAALAGQLREPVHDVAGVALAGRAVVFGGGAATESSDIQAWSGGTSRVIGALPEGRSDAAVAVVDATAYVVGGFDGQGMTRSILASTDGRSVHPVGRLRVGVRYPAVAAYRGSVWVFGGQLATTEGTSSGAQSDVIQRFDVATGKTVVVGHLPRTLGHAMAFRTGHRCRVAGRLRLGVRYPAVAAFAGRIYVFGGEQATTAGSAGGPETDAIQMFDPGIGRTRVVGHLPRTLGHAAAFTLGGNLYLAGGRHGTTATARIWRIAVTGASAHAVPAGRLPRPVTDMAVAAIGRNRVLLLGGETAGPFAPQSTILAVRAR